MLQRIPRPLLAGTGACLAGAATGALALQRGPLDALAAVLLPLVVVALLRSLWVAYLGILAVICLLPFAVLPVGTSVTPAVLEVAILVALALTAAVVLVDRRLAIPAGAAQALVLAFAGMTAFALLIGLGRGYTTQTFHDYLKFLLSIATFWLTIQLVRGVADARLITRLLALGIAGAAAIALLLYAAGPAFSERVLARLIPYGYPGARIVRYIEDDPERAMRAVGTSVDPNSFGGLLMVGVVIAGGQLLVRQRSLPRWLVLGALLAIAPALLVTYSRGAWIGALAGIAIVVLARRPWMALPAVLLAAGGIAAGIGSAFVERLWLGFTLQDPATKLRLAEYRNAWEIIRAHPWFGVGYGDAPSIEQQTGVSSIYLALAQQAGLIGLAIFLLASGLIVWRGLRLGWRERGERSDLTLTLTAAFSAMLVTGLVDHYLVNPQFPHMVALFWIVGGLIVGLVDSDAQMDAVSSRMRRVTNDAGTVSGGSSDGEAARRGARADRDDVRPGWRTRPGETPA